ncbi:MAG: SpoIIE family protein phosphatase [Bacteroidetes bacterium]|nr:SpoIIE family protein phosphatase [Bacteroidota bacterium]
MARLKITDWKKPGTRIVVTVFGALFILSAYFIVYTDYTYLKVSEENSLSRLRAVANTLALQIDGDQHKALADKYKKQGELHSNTDDTLYYAIWKQLHNAYKANNLVTEISTLVLDKPSRTFYYVVNSTDKPYIHDPYVGYHKEFLEHYETGDVVHQYTDEFGTWLTAFCPIKNAKGEVTGIVEVDESFALFKAESRSIMIRNLLITLCIFIVTVIVLLRYIRVILRAEEKSKLQIEQANLVISQKNKDILDSINYARRIQSAILAPRDEVFSTFRDAFILYKPKDIVSGDFYFYSKTETRAIIAAADCTGHGVPGALMSMIGNDLLHHITRDLKVEKPSAILDLLHQGVVNILKQDGKQTDTRDGMDIALMSFDLKTLQVEYAGAYRSFYIYRKGELIEYKANKFPIGNTQQERTQFTNHNIQLEKGDMCYAFTDGYADQFGGEMGKKFMMKRFQTLLAQIYDEPVDVQEQRLDQEIESWKGNMEQVDDILVIGIRV